MKSTAKQTEQGPYTSKIKQGQKSIETGKRIKVKIRNLWKHNQEKGWIEETNLIDHQDKGEEWNRRDNHTPNLSCI